MAGIKPGEGLRFQARPLLKKSISPIAGDPGIMIVGPARGQPPQRFSSNRPVGFGQKLAAHDSGLENLNICLDIARQYHQ
jgi:hypothetical protein